MTKKEGAVLETENSIQKELHTINDVALMLNVHQQTLRNWERKKLVAPLRAGTRRVYTKQHIELCKKIKEFSGKGVPLKGIKEIINNIQ
jgi:DNA-binding transcriptional MerR regulator